MDTFWVVVISLFSYWAIGLIVYFVSGKNEDIMRYWGAGLLFFILYVLAYPIRAMKTYSRSRGYYERNGISRIGYLFGKRVKQKDDEN